MRASAGGVEMTGDVGPSVPRPAMSFRGSVERVQYGAQGRFRPVSDPEVAPGGEAEPLGAK